MTEPKKIDSDDSFAKQAQYFLDLLHMLERQNSSESKRIRLALLEAVDDYGKTNEETPEKARGIVRERLGEIQGEALPMLIRSSKAIHKKVSQQSRKMGTKSTEAKTARGLADGMGHIVDALETMREAVQTKDAALQAEAETKMSTAKALMAQFQ